MKPGAGLAAFVLRVFLWLPACFAAWYLCAPQYSAIAGAVAHALVDCFAAGTVSGIERSGLDLAFVTRIAVHPGGSADAVLLVDVNPLIYTYGLALYLALMLAARARAWKLLVGAGLLLCFQGWGIAFEFLADIAIKLGPGISTQVGLAGWRREAIALGYQVGCLILPSLAPVVLWALLNRAFIEGMLAPRAPGAFANAQTPPRSTLMLPR